MTFAVEILKNRVRKNTLVVLKPRYFVSNFTNYSGVIYYTDFPYGYVNRVSATMPGYGATRTTSGAAYLTSVGSIGAVTAGTFYWDHANSRLYVGSWTNPSTDGRTLEYELYMATDAFTGPRDPLDSTSQVVDWLPVLEKSPSVIVGSRSSLYGTQPLQQSTLIFLNGDGWFNEQFHEASLRSCVVKSWVVADDTLEHAIANSNVQTVFIGYTAESATYQDDKVSIACVDFLKVLDNPVTSYGNYNLVDFPDIDESVVVPNQEWEIRRFWGMSDGVELININVDTASVSTNRDWMAGSNAGRFFLLIPVAVTAVCDHTASNTATRTYFTTTPQFNVGDTITLTRTAVLKYAKVTAINRSSKYIDHTSVTGSVASGDAGSRWYITNVEVEDEDGTIWTLQEANWSIFPSGGSLGISLDDDWEAALGFTHSPFDPTKHRIRARVYGYNADPTYSDSTALGGISDEGGVLSESHAVIFQLLTEAGIESSLIDKNSFSSVTSHNVGFALPLTPSGEMPTYKEMIDKILFSNIWKLGFVVSSNDIKIGVVAVQPFPSSADVDVDDVLHNSFSYEQDYRDIYFRVNLNYLPKDLYFGSTDVVSVASSISARARDVHFSTKVFTGDILQYVSTEADEAAERLSYVFSERRGYLSFVTTAEFISLISSLGSTLDIIRERLPGFEFAPGTENSRQGSIVELQKSANGVSIVIEDQKGIQANSGNW